MARGSSIYRFTLYVFYKRNRLKGPFGGNAVCLRQGGGGRSDRFKLALSNHRPCSTIDVGFLNRQALWSGCEGLQTL